MDYEQLSPKSNDSITKRSIEIIISFDAADLNVATIGNTKYVIVKYNGDYKVVHIYNFK